MTAGEHELIALGDSDRTVAKDDDIRGRTVIDVGGEEIGKIDDLLIDAEEQKVRFLIVASGGFLGIGEQKSYIPVDAVASVDDDRVRIDQSRERLRSAPVYDPDLINDVAYNEDVFAFYGLEPFWSAGYTYPTYPFYR
ncbi:PRC-barrel domain-containing protein [Microbacterium suwonense]|uniref:Photosystem reaction center subunit H n=1 Tax=Microbacterium suwonense TaxID=683047 RepID=A0ABN6X8L8_9MICO|nr:PRC-barrel domain-containing protein [Microbacterium suwonense]BDZ40413.1 photosystem reaction center subunit H [Microbacterium suwonense]